MLIGKRVIGVKTGVMAVVLFSSLLAATACRSKSSSLQSADAPADSSNATVSNSRCAAVTAKSFTLPPSVPAAASCNQLVTQFSLVDTPKSDEDTVICPFLRILYRSNILANEIASNLGLDFIKAQNMTKPVSVDVLASAASTFGCGAACKGVASQVSTGQGFDKLGSNSTPYVDIGNLYTAKGVAHDCGFNFALGDHQASDAVRNATLALFKTKADSKNGRITLQDLNDVKQASCDRDYALHMANPALPYSNDIQNGSFIPGSADVIEVGLIFSLLGGVDEDTNGSNQSVAYSDLEQLFKGTLPADKTQFVVDAPLFAHIMGGALFGNIISAKIHEACLKYLPLCPF